MMSTCDSEIIHDCSSLLATFPRNEHRQAPTLAEGETLRRNEFRYGSFRRVLSLPVAINPQGVSADYQAGILVVTLPKAEDKRNKNDFRYTFSGRPLTVIRFFVDWGDRHIL